MPNRKQYWVIDENSSYAYGPYESINKALKVIEPDDYNGALIVQIIGKIAVEPRFVPIEPE